MLKILAQTQVEIPKPLQDAAHQLTMWVCIGAVTIPIIILLLLIAKLYAEKGLEWIAEKIAEWLNKKKK